MENIDVKMFPIFKLYYFKCNRYLPIPGHPHIKYITHIYLYFSFHGLPVTSTLVQNEMNAWKSSGCFLQNEAQT